MSEHNLVQKTNIASDLENEDGGELDLKPDETSIHVPGRVYVERGPVDKASTTFSHGVMHICMRALQSRLRGIDLNLCDAIVSQ